MTTGMGGVRRRVGAARPGLPVWWSCLDCAEHGEGDRAAERHTRDTQHATVTTVRPPSKET